MKFSVFSQVLGMTFWTRGLRRSTETSARLDQEDMAMDDCKQQSTKLNDKADGMHCVLCDNDDVAFNSHSILSMPTKITLSFSVELARFFLKIECRLRQKLTNVNISNP